MSTAKYFSSRWKAQVPFPSLFWRDLILLGSILNLLVFIIGLMLLAQGYPAAWAVAASFLLLPYNLFLVLSVWRWPEVNVIFKVISGAWFVLMAFI
jgi:hypothetical protein